VSGGHLAGDLRLGGAEAVVILPGWGGTRYGPQRILWQTARAIAERGSTTLRIDLRGRGDSTGDEAATLDGMIEDAVASVRWLRREHGVGRVHLVGICSGGNVALGAAGLLDDIGTVVCWSLLPFMEHKTKAAKQGTPRTGLLLAMARKALRPETWRKLFRGEVNVKGAAQVLAKDKEGDDAEKARKTSARDILADLAKGFTGDLRLLYGEKDPEAPGSQAFFEEWCRSHAVRVETAVILGAPHTYYTATWTRAVVERTSAWLEPNTAAAPRPCS
jgi:pimeloyl-ACP methyl ester carboxylesterase